MDLGMQIKNGLQSQGLPAPSLSWIQSAMPTRDPPPPLPALVATAKARFLAADLTQSNLLEPPASALPANLSNPHIKESQLSHDVLIQVLDIENLSKSKWEQVEELEAIARGEQTRGREVVRLPTSNEDDDDGSDATVATQSSNPAPRPSAARSQAIPKNSTHRLVLQDCQGQKVHGIELRRIDRIASGALNIGEKLMIKKGTVIARGVVLLEPTSCSVLGGKVEAWQKAWQETRLSRLLEAVGTENRG